MEKLQRATLPAGPASLAFFGVAFARLWLTFIFVEPGTAVGVAPLPHDVFDWAFAGVSLAVALGARHLVPLSGRRRSYVLVLAAMLAATAVAVLDMAAGAAPALRVAGALLGGAGYAGFLLLNAEAFAGVSILRIILYLSGSRVLAFAMAYLLAPVDPVRMGAVLVLAPFVAVVLVRTSYATLAPADRQRAGYPRFHYPWKLLVLLGVFSFAYGLRQAVLAPGAGQHSSLSTAIAMGTVFLLAYLLSNRVDVARLCRLPLPVMACGLLLVPAEGLLGQVVSSYLVSIAYTLATFTIGVLLYDMAKRTGVAVAPLMGGMNAMQIFVVLGNYASRGLDTAFLDDALADAVVAVIVCVALAVSFFLLFSERELSSRWGIRVLQETSLGEEASEVDRLQGRCDELVRSFGLTAREDEVLRELARQKDNQAIAQNLLIAPGTLKAHTRHIYEKMGIHTRAELNALLGLGE